MIGAVSDAPPDPASDPARGGTSGWPRHRRESQEEEPGSEPAEPTFPPKPLLRTGYDRAAVDEFVTKVVLALHNERQTSVSADEVARKRFPARRLGPGYRMREVDDYLGVAEALLRLRATERGVGPDPHTPHEEPEHHHHPTWWIYGVAVLLAVVIVVFTLTRT